MKPTRPYISLPFKLMLLLSLATTALFTLAIPLIYHQSVNSLHKEAIENRREMARLMASSIADTIDKEFGLVKLNAAKELSGRPGAENAIGDLLFDEAQEKWRLTFLAPVEDNSGQPIGVYKSLVDIGSFFNSLQDFKLGKTGDAAIVDDKTYLVFHPRTQPFINKFSISKYLERLLASSSKGLTIDTAYNHTGKTFAVFAEVSHPLLLKKGIKWYCVIAQDEKELLSPLKTLIWRVIVTAVSLLTVTMLAGFILGRLFIKPLQKLNEGMRRLAYGDSDYKVVLNSKDEIGQAAASFNEMAEAVKKDIDELKNVKGELENINEETANLNCLKMNLTAVLTQSRGVLSGLKGGAELDRLAHNINTLLDIVGLESGSILLKIEVIDIKDLLKNAVFALEPKITQKGLDFKLNIPKGKVCINADSLKVIEVLNILIQNAIKFTQKGRIEVSIKESGDKAEFSVFDTGVGIPKEHLPYVFDGYKYEKNKGLGLYFAKTIIKTHKSDIRVESEPGKGTTFIFTLPRVIHI